MSKDVLGAIILMAFVISSIFAMLDGNWPGHLLMAVLTVGAVVIVRLVAETLWDMAVREKNGTSS